MSGIGRDFASDYCYLGACITLFNVSALVHQEHRILLLNGTKLYYIYFEICVFNYIIYIFVVIFRGGCSRNDVRFMLESE